MNKPTWTFIAAALVLAVFAVIMRLFPHAANVAPIGALAFWSGRYLNDRWSYALPIVVLVISDALIGFYSWPIMLAVYLGWLVMTVLGASGSHTKKPVVLFGSVLTGSVIFFVLTNAAVWGFSSLYPKTIAGLVSCFTQAIPFFRNSLLGDLFYSAMFVGVTEFIRAGFLTRSVVWIRTLFHPAKTVHALKTGSLR